MLSDSDKERIRLEEDYRKELQARETPPPKPKPAWTFLNSSFGLWLFSAVFITGLGAAFTKYQERLSAIQKNEEAVDRLDFEMGYRFSQLQMHLFTASELPEDQREVRARTIIQNLRLPPGADFQHLFPEYAGYSMPALVAELHRREDPALRPRRKPKPEDADADAAPATAPGPNIGLPSDAEIRRKVDDEGADDPLAARQHLERVLGHLTGLPLFFKVRGALFSDPRTMAAHIAEELMLGRWRGKGWYFTEGSKEEPFP